MGIEQIVAEHLAAAVVIVLGAMLVIAVAVSGVRNLRLNPRHYIRRRKD